ncbi:MAG TPA: response regulator [Dehalococcoidia bacterium]|nr:response regulator [Dehalococcoidia bacterium]
MPKILIIENEPSIQKLMKVNLSTSGYEVLITARGEEGLRLAQQESPDLILLDLRLPGISGWDVLARLKAIPELGKIPVVIITAVVHHGDEEKAYAMGVAGYLAKPFTAEELLQEVEEALRRGSDASPSDSHR